MNVIANCAQGCSGAVVEYLLPYLKVEGSRPPCVQILLRCIAGKFRQKTQQKIQAHMPKTFFCAMYEMSQQHPVWVAENRVKPCNSVVS